MKDVVDSIIAQSHLNDLANSLRGIGHVPDNEKQLQAMIANCLTAAGFRFQREYPTKTGPVDFAIFIQEEVLAMEVKLSGSAMEISRQLTRYLQDPQFSLMVLVTCKPVILPISQVETVDGCKAILVIELWRQFL